ncbi:MAG: PBP1A family penicillin-binding protein [Carnobacterium sp.]|uniref:PBP1A family penicillin-binding protein n=1 Tax=Carnobacterium sp. TaxID=48221 RepID=UPI0033151FC9
MSEKKEMSRVSKKQAQKSKHTKKGKKSKKSSSPLWKKILIGILALIAAVLIGGMGLFAYYVSSAPDVTENNLTDTVSSTLLDSEGNEFLTLGGENRELISENDVPQVLKDAIVAIEDQRFYTHIGIDPIRIAGAVVANITDGFASEGGSTITQQLIKLSVFSTGAEDQTLKRKAQEAWLSLQLEQKYSKEQILTFYINKVYMSDNQYGMGTASEYYFGKPLAELTLPQAALLAGMPQAPNAYNPLTNPEDATKRRNLVLDMMVENEAITSSEAQEAKSVDVSEGLIDHSGEETNNLVFDPYVKEVLAEVERKTNLDPYTSGLTIYTNLDMDAQQRLYDIVNSDKYVLIEDEDIQTGISLVDVNTGQLKALGGARDQEVQLGTNYATELNRSVGSNIKPLSAYGPAIEYLNYSTYEQVVDEPYTFKDGTPINNYDNNYEGQISLRRALVDSRNVPTTKIYNDVPREQADEFLTNIGIDTSTLNPGANNLVESNGFTGNITPVDLSGAYAAFANGGTYTEPYTVSKIVLEDGEEISLKPESNKAMEESTAYMITDMLKDVASNNSSRVGLNGIPQAGKTGTTNYTEEKKIEHNIPENGVPDKWYTGYTTNYALSVWVGKDDYFDSIDNTGSERLLPQQIYQALMSYVSESVESSDWTKPSSVVEVAVEKGSMPAKLAGPNTPSDKIVTELFVKGTEPTAVAVDSSEEEEKEESEEEEIELNAPEGLTATYDEETDALSIKWNAYSEKDISYLLTIGSESYSTNDLSYILQNPPEGEISITLAVQAGDQTGPAASTSVLIPPKEEEEEPEEEKPEEESSENSSSSSSSEESSSTPPESSSSSSSSEESSSAPDESSSSSSSSQPSNSAPEE